MDANAALKAPARTSPRAANTIVAAADKVSAPTVPVGGDPSRSAAGARSPSAFVSRATFVRRCVCSTLFFFFPSSFEFRGMTANFVGSFCF
jgi:hypothetical protein